MRLLQLQAHDSAIDRLEHRRGSLPEDARLAELPTPLRGGPAHRRARGHPATVQRDQSRLEHEIDTITAKARGRGGAGRLRQGDQPQGADRHPGGGGRPQAPPSTLEDELLELMEQRETLEGELAELATRRDGFTAEQADDTKARDAALVEIDRELDGERTAREAVAPEVGEQLRALYDQVRARLADLGGCPGRQHLPGLPGVDLPGGAGRHPQAPPTRSSAARTAAGSWWSNDGPDRGGGLDRRRRQGQPGPAGYGAVVTTPAARCWPRSPRGSAGRPTTSPSTRRDRRPAPGQGAGCPPGPGPGRLSLVVNQQKGLWKVKNAALRPLADEAARLARQFDRVTWQHVPRERNRRADALANRAMDDQGRVARPPRDPRPGAAPAVPGHAESDARGRPRRRPTPADPCRRPPGAGRPARP